MNGRGGPPAPWKAGWRDRLWDRLAGPWDLIIVGGGITGAGILREATRAGLRALLVEAGDFGSGTSSRSSKMVHGGFRYLRNAQLRLTLESVRERELLLHQAKGLISPMAFLLACHSHDRIPSWLFGLGLTIYDLFGLRWGHRWYPAGPLRQLCPQLSNEQLLGGYRYFDAQVDDARLVLRVLKEAVYAGGVALNYAPAVQPLLDRAGQVRGVALEDRAPDGNGRTAEVRAAAVINASGAWSDDLRAQIGQGPRLRKLRGGHLLFPWQAIPLARAVSFLHPRDARPVFIFPWEGVTLYGTTDVDHGPRLQSEVPISAAEVEYLMEGLQHAFPGLGLSEADLLATFAGVRPVVDSGKANPSRESREHVLWRENGLLTVTGGKLTTFRTMAHDALRAVRGRLRDRIPGRMMLTRRLRVFDKLDNPLPPELELSPAVSSRLLGRYGVEALSLAQAARPGELEPIEPTPTVWAELRWAARAEGVVHLDDLLLRRLRLGLTLPEGGLNCAEAVRSIVQPELGWDDQRWQAELQGYARRWRQCYSPSAYRRAPS